MRGFFKRGKVEAHGGYLCRLEGFGSLDLVSLALSALAVDGLDAESCGLQVSALRRRKIIRLAYDAPAVYGRSGAHWYADHHALAQQLSDIFPVTVHAYVFDPEEFEQVVAYGGGRQVGGELVRYEDVELPEETAFNEAAFERLKERWPLGHLAHIFGITRPELLALPRAPSLLLDLATPASNRMLADLWNLDPGRGLIAASR